MVLAFEELDSMRLQADDPPTQKGTEMNLEIVSSPTYTFFTFNYYTYTKSRLTPKKLLFSPDISYTKESSHSSHQEK